MRGELTGMSGQSSGMERGMKFIHRQHTALSSHVTKQKWVNLHEEDNSKSP